MAMDLNFQTNSHEALRKGILELTKRQGYRGSQNSDITDNNSLIQETVD